jgi:DNA polymerase (family 10)
LHNADIASKFSDYADLLEIKGENRFRIRSYRDAARLLDSLSRDIVDMVDSGADLTELNGVGDAIAEKIETIVETGQLPQLEELKEKLPPGLLDVLQVEGLGPKKTKKLYTQLSVETLEQLESAAKEEQIRQIKGFGPKTEQKILDNIERVRRGNERTRLADMRKRAEPLVAHLDELSEVEKLEIAGSYRRHKETVGDLDILVACEDSAPVMEAFTGYEDVIDIIAEGETKSTVRIRPDIQVDLRVVETDVFGAALHYFTGSKAHNIACRQRAINEGLKVSEYGVFRDDTRIAGETEVDVYDAIDLPYIEPELRENQGEIEAAVKGELPDLIEQSDIRGDLHCHTTASDGLNSIEEMAEKAIELGYDYLSISDHSKSSRVAGGLTEEELLAQTDEIDRVNDEIDELEILKSNEVDILQDGGLDFDESTLAELDIVVCSVHSNFGLSEVEQTERVLTALEHPQLDILGHPTGRLLGKRQPYDIDVEAILDKAAELDKVVELNAQPARLDLNASYCRAAKEKGVKIAISTDAHQRDHLEGIEYGIFQARRGWLEPEDVINTRPLSDLVHLID